MSRCTAVLILFVLASLVVLAGCGVESGYSPLETPPASIPTLETPTSGVMLYVQAGSSQSTAQAAVATAEFYGSQLTATSQQREWDATATWSSFNQTATQQSWNATSTAASDQATSTALAQAAATGTAGAATQVAFNVTSTAAFADARTYATAMAGQAASVDLGVKRDIMTNNIKAAAPWVVTGILFVAALIVAWRWSRIRIIRTGQAGDKPLLVDVIDGTVTDPDLSVNPQTGTRKDDRQLSAPAPEVQARVKIQDQMLDLGTRGTGPGTQADSRQSARRQAAEQMAASNALQVGPSQVKFLPPADAAGMVKDVIPAIVEDATGVQINDQEEKK